MKEFTDFEIIQSFKERKNEAVAYAIQKYKPMIRMMLLKSGAGAATNEAAKDLLQEGLIIITNKIDEGGLILKCTFKTFLYSVCENLYKMQLKKNGIEQRYFALNSFEIYADDFSEDIDFEKYNNLFYRHFERLGNMCRTFLKLYWQEISPQEIASKLGISYGYVRKHKSQCLKQLIENIHKDPEYKKLTL